MQNHVTPATAQRLKDAGFPQPEFEIGQFWYSSKNDPWYVGAYSRHKKEKNTLIVIRELFSVNWLCIGDVIGFIFAPTATDILRELGRDWQLEYFDAKECWEISFFFRDSSSGWYTAENPAEAAALAWLSIHEKK